NLPKPFANRIVEAEAGTTELRPAIVGKGTRPGIRRFGIHRPSRLQEENPLFVCRDSSLELTPKLPKLPWRQPQVEPRLCLIDTELASGLERKLAFLVRPEYLHRFQLADAANVGEKSHREAEIELMLRVVDLPEPDLVPIAADFDGIDAGLGVR